MGKPLSLVNSYIGIYVRKIHEYKYVKRKSVLTS